MIVLFSSVPTLFDSCIRVLVDNIDGKFCTFRIYIQIIFNFSFSNLAMWAVSFLYIKHHKTPKHFFHKQVVSQDSFVVIVESAPHI